MKKAKVTAKGYVTQVWPWVKTLPDGSTTVKEFPHQKHHDAKGIPLPDCFVDVPDDVQVGWVWRVDLQAYAPRVKHVPQKPHSDLLEVVAEKIGVPYAELWDEVQRRKKERKAALKK